MSTDREALRDFADTYYKQTTVITSMWTVFVVATFAAAGFAQLGESFREHLIIAIAITLGFSAFARGHWVTLRNEVEARRLLGQSLLRSLDDAGAVEDEVAAYRLLATRAATPAQSRGFHVIIDVCVIASIWTRVLIG